MRLLTSSAITREDYAKNPQAVLDVLEFYTDHQKREYEEYGIIPSTGAPASGVPSAPQRAYPQTEAARFAGVGLAGAKSSSTSSLPGVSAQPYPATTTARPAIGRQDTAPGNLNTQPSQYRGPSPAVGAPQASRVAPPRPLVAGRAPPPAPADQGPSKDAIASRQRAEADRRDRERAQRERERTEQRERSRQQGDSPERPTLVPSKSAPATTQPEAVSADLPAGALVGPPPVKPLQTGQKSEPAKEAAVAAAAAALESKPKGPPPETERRISTLSEPQIMEKLRQVVSQDDPKTIYATIKKIGQGLVASFDHSPG